jgi:site-specific DNA-cytosine methylase
MSQEKPIKWGTIVPLIGGMTIGNAKAVGHDPDFLISYEAFGGNDSHCTAYFEKTPYIIADAESNMLPSYDQALFEDVDFVSAVCPCAGLSMLNSSRNTSGMSRGADAAQNDWMYKSARLVLEQVRPKVFWGENAPGLYSKMGEKVVEKLRAIGKEFGYSFSMVKTNTFLHGIPQNRMRTFYFFWRDTDAPLLNFYERKAPILEEYLADVPADAKHMDQYFGIGRLEESGWFQFAKAKGWSARKLIESEYKTIQHWMYGEGLMDEGIAWAEENENTGMVKFINHVKNKLSQGLGYWDGTPLIFKEATNAIIAKNAAIVHPTEERGITLREAMYLMGLPHDFELQDGHWNHICQNVPTTTAADWTAEVVRYIKGEIQEFGGEFVKQNNINKRIEHTEYAVSSKSLF